MTFHPPVSLGYTLLVLLGFFFFPFLYHRTNSYPGSESGRKSGVAAR